MAVFVIADNPCDTDLALENLCHYIIQECRTCGVVGGRGLNPDFAYEDISQAQALWNKNFGRRAYHFVLSFDDLELVTPTEAEEIADRFSNLFFSAQAYQVLFGVHLTQAHRHIHFAVSTVSLETGLKLHMDFEKLRQLRSAIQEIMSSIGCWLS